MQKKNLARVVLSFHADAVEDSGMKRSVFLTVLGKVLLVATNAYHVPQDPGTVRFKDLEEVYKGVVC